MIDYCSLVFAFQRRRIIINEMTSHLVNRVHEENDRNHFRISTGTGSFSVTISDKFVGIFQTTLT